MGKNQDTESVLHRFEVAPMHLKSGFAGMKAV